MMEYKNKVNAVFLGALGLILGLIVLRFLLTLLGLSSESVFTQIVMGITDPLVAPFGNILRLEQVGNLVFDIAALLALIIGLILGLLLHDLVMAFFQDDGRKVSFSVVNILFKLVEFLLITRIVFKIFGIVALAGTFSNSIYNLTAWSSTIFPDIALFNGVIEISTILFLILTIGLDVFTERIVASGWMTRIADKLLEWFTVIKPMLTKLLPNKSSAVIKDDDSTINSTVSKQDNATDPQNMEVPTEPTFTPVEPAPSVPNEPETAPNAFSSAVLEVEAVQNVHQDKQ